MESAVTKTFAEHSVVRLRTAMPDDRGRPVDEGATGTIVFVHTTPTGQEPAYTVEVIRTPTDSSLVEVRHGDVELLKAPASETKIPGGSWFLFVVACLCGIGSVMSINFCAESTNRGDRWSVLGYLVVIAPLFGSVSLAALIFSSVTYARRRLRLDQASVLLTGGSLLVTIVLVILLLQQK